MKWLMVLVLAASVAFADANEDAAQAAAGPWLKLVDEGNYEASWEQAAAGFRSVVTKDQWSQAVARGREPLGKLISRKLRSSRYTESLPGAPNGKYVVIQFDAAYEKNAQTVENLVAMQEADGAWKIVGYTVR